MTRFINEDIQAKKKKYFTYVWSANYKEKTLDLKPIFFPSHQTVQKSFSMDFLKWIFLYFCALLNLLKLGVWPSSCFLHNIQMGHALLLEILKKRDHAIYPWGGCHRALYTICTVAALHLSKVPSRKGNLNRRQVPLRDLNYTK